LEPVGSRDSKKVVCLTYNRHQADWYSIPTDVLSKRQTRKISCTTCHGWKVRCVGITATNATCETCSRLGRTCQPYVTKHPGSVISACLSCRRSKIKCKEGETGGPCKTCFLHKQTCSYVETRSGFEAKKPRKYKKVGRTKVIMGVHR